MLSIISIQPTYKRVFTPTSDSAKSKKRSTLTQHYIREDQVYFHPAMCEFVYVHVHVCMCLHENSLDLINKQGKTTNLNKSFFTENEKKSAQVGFKPTTSCLLGKCLTTELPWQLNGWVESKLYTKAV